MMGFIFRNNSQNQARIIQKKAYFFPKKKKNHNKIRN